MSAREDGGVWLDAEGWYTVVDRDASPFERARDAQIEGMIVRDGRPPPLIAILARQQGVRWEIKIWQRVDMLMFLDDLGRRDTDAKRREVAKETAAWIRGLGPGVCPQIFVWESCDGRGAMQLGTIERAPADATERP